MPSLPEAQAALTGFGRLLRLDAGFVQWFDRSPAGALRSFGLMLPMLPLFALNVGIAVAGETDLDMVRLVAGSAILYVLGWILFPLTLIVICRALEREPQAIGTIAFYNWYSAIFSLIQTAISVLGYVSGNDSAIDTISSIVYLATLVLEGFALRILIGLGIGGAILLVVVDFFITKGLVQIWLALAFDKPFF